MTALIGTIVGVSGATGYSSRPTMAVDAGKHTTESHIRLRLAKSG
jgi:hypothetical protein